MFFLQKCLTSFLVPPGIFVPLLLAVAWRSHRCQQSRQALALILVALSIWTVSTPLASRTIMKGIERGVHIPEHIQGDVIVLLGGGIHDKVPDLSGRGTPSTGSLPRVVTAARLQKRLGIPVIISGGGVFAGRTVEGVISRRFLTDLGVPNDKILIEGKSRDTLENARFTRQIMEKHGFRQPLLVTSAYHMQRSVLAFRRSGIEVVPVPSHFISGGDPDVVWFDLLPDALAMNEVSQVLKEHIGMIYYRLVGKGGT